MLKEYLNHSPTKSTYHYASVRFQQKLHQSSKQAMQITLTTTDRYQSCQDFQIYLKEQFILSLWHILRLKICYLNLSLNFVQTDLLTRNNSVLLLDYFMKKNLVKTISKNALLFCSRQHCCKIL